MYALFTGAGFSHNFGAPLADGMWAKLYNHPALRALPMIRQELRDSFDYEAVYTKVIEDDSFSESDGTGFSDAIFHKITSGADAEGANSCFWQHPG